MTMTQRTEAGSYERKQLMSPSGIIRWSHGRRFDVAMRYVEQLGGQSLIDYGCGDGTFLKRARGVVRHCVGSDMHPVDSSIVRTADLDASHDGRYDLVFCMEVIEHCVAHDVDTVLADLRRLVSATGAIVISVPIEIGPTLIGKQIVRRLLGMRKIGEYEWTVRYKWPELIKMVFADGDTSIHRPSISSGDSGHHHAHHGFNWKALRDRLGHEFAVDEPSFSPLSWTRGLASSQAWFVCRPKLSTSAQ